MGTPFLVSIIKDVCLELKVLEIVYHANGSVVEGIYDRDEHKWKLVGEVKSFCWGFAWTKGEAHECKLTKNMFLHIYFLDFCLKQKHNITELFSDKTVFTIRKLAFLGNGLNIEISYLLSYHIGCGGGAYNQVWIGLVSEFHLS